MQSHRMFAVYFVFYSVAWIEFCSAALVIRVSKISGGDRTSCRVSDATSPCKTIKFALGALEETKNLNETVFTFSIEDKVYTLKERVSITQTSALRNIYLKSNDSRRRSVVHCGARFAGIEVGASDIYARNTRNVHFVNLVFQNCGSPRFAAVVLIWNSLNVDFTNCVFRHNTQAAINAFDSAVAIDTCLFSNNTSNLKNSSEQYRRGVDSAGGGAGFLFRDSANLTLVVKNSIFDSNAAGTNRSNDFIAPSSNVTHFSSCGGGLLVVFSNKAENCQALIDNTVFKKNTATYGGGLYLANTNLAVRNSFMVTNSNFTGNQAGQTGGGALFSQWDKASKITTIYRKCIFSENESQRGAGMNVFLMNYDVTPNDSILRFDTVTFSNNIGNASTAIRFTTALPFARGVDMTPEFINCTFKNNNMSNYARTSPFTSQRVDVNFTGRNIFQQNYGGGAAAFQDCVLNVHGHLTFANNTGSNGGALFMRSSQIILHPGSTMVFLGNRARGVGGAIFVWEHLMAEFIHVNNPDCFIAYSDPKLPPSKWKTNVSFIENSSAYKGAAIYISSLQRCMWTEDYPFYDPRKALRWYDNFVYRNNSLTWNGGVNALTGTEFDIATDTKRFQATEIKNSTLKLTPGEQFSLNLQALDELGNEVFTMVYVSEVGQVSNYTSEVLLGYTMYAITPEKRVPFSFTVPKTLYDETRNKMQTRIIQFVDPFSTLGNGYSFEMELQPCLPGFKYEDHTQGCVCDTDHFGVQRCEDGRTVYLKEGFWGGLNKRGDLVTYFCPFQYCNCTSTPGLPGCLFDPDNIDRQCADNREGWLCGKCKVDTSVGLRSSECISCEKSGWVLIVVIPVVIGLCVLIIWLNPGISSELRGPLFFFQVLPYIFDPTSYMEGVALLSADMFNFGGPLIYLFRTCIVEGLDNLYAIAFGYMIPFLALFVFVVAYLLSVNYRLKFNLRKRSMLQSFWLILLFVYNYLVKTSFLILFCPSVGDKHVFYYDGSVECFHGIHLPMGIMAIFVLAVLVVPPPIGVILLTNGYWRVGPQYVNVLTSGLRTERRWWWSVDLCRRVLLLATFAFIPNWYTKQIVIIAVCVLILAVHSNCHPYERPRANYAESMYLVVLCTLALMQLVKDDYAGLCVCLVLLIVLGLHTLVVFWCKAVLFFRKRFDCCACVDPTLLRRYGYEVLQETRSEESKDTEAERRRSMLNAVFSAVDGENNLLTDT